MSSYGWSYPTSLQRIQNVRSVAHINKGFEIQLKAYSHANYDVYIAQQVLLQGRVRAVQSYRSIEGNSADELIVKASARKKFGSLHTIGSNGNTSSRRHCSQNSGNNKPGSKRSWGSAKDDDDTLSSSSEDAEEDEDMEGAAPAVTPSHPDTAPLSSSCRTPSTSTSMSFGHQHHHRHHHAAAVAVASPRHSHSSLPSSDPSSSSTLAPVAVQHSNSFKLRQQVPLMDPRSPRLRLSRPGSTSIRVIPPLRGLERVFCCSWCHCQLFNLASVIRTDVHVHPLPDPHEANSLAGDKHGFDQPHSSHRHHNASSLISPRRGEDKQEAQEKDSFNSYLMPAPSPRWSSQAVPLSPHPDDAKISFLPLSANKSFSNGGGGGSNGYKSPPKTMRSKGGGMKSFDFDFENAGALPPHGGSPRANLPSFHEDEGGGEAARATSPMEISDEKLSPIKEGKADSAFTMKDEKSYLLEPPLSSSRRSSKMENNDQPAPHLSSIGRSASGSNSYRGKAPGGGIVSTLGNASHLLTETVESPRIAFPHGPRESYSYPPNRPQSAEKRRWLARVNLLKSDVTSHEAQHDTATATATEQQDPFSHVPSRSHRHDAKVAKLSSDDDEAILLGFGREKYIHLEYLEWMGEDLLSIAIEAGELKCGHCHCVIGSWTWNPSSRSVSHAAYSLLGPCLVFLSHSLLIQTKSQRSLAGSSHQSP
jgi:hypothetical protein